MVDWFWLCLVGVATLLLGLRVGGTMVARDRDERFILAINLHCDIVGRVDRIMREVIRLRYDRKRRAVLANVRRNDGLKAVRRFGRIEDERERLLEQVELDRVRAGSAEYAAALEAAERGARELADSRAADIDRGA